MNINLFKNLRFSISIGLLIFLSVKSIANIHFTESFTSPNFPTTSTTTGTFVLSSGTWDVQNVTGLETINAYNGTGQAAKLARYVESFLTTPSVNNVGSISFYYRNFASMIGGGSFIVQKSVNNGAFADISTVSFTSATSYTLFSINVNDASSNIRFRIYCPVDVNDGMLCIDEIVVTDMGQTLAANPTTLSEINYYEGFGPSESKSFNLFGSNLTGASGNIAINSPSNYEISTDNTTFTNSLSVAYSSSTLPQTPIYVRLKTGLAVNTYNSELINISGGGVASFDVTCNGSVTVKPLPSININNLTLSGFSYVFGSGPSTAKNYSISVTNLTEYPGNIVVTAPADYEVSLDFAMYSSSLNIPYNSATLASTIVYVRLKSGLSVNSYSESITNEVEGVSASVLCNGSVSAPTIPTLSVSSATLTGFSYFVGLGPSASQTYTINGSNLTGYPSDINVTAPTNYEVSNDNITFTSVLNIPYTSSTLDLDTVYVRLKSGLAVGSYNSEIISNSGGGATTINVQCYGNVTNPPAPILSLNVNSLSGFTYSQGSGPSIPQSFDLSGVNLINFPSTITVTAPTNYEVSINYPTFASIVNVPYDSATLSWIPIHVRLKAGLNQGNYNAENITISGNGASDVTVTCNGSVSAPVIPTLSVNVSSLSGFNYILGTGPSTSQSYNLSGSNLTGAPGTILVTAPTNYEISLNNSTFSNTENIAYSSSTLSSTPIYLRLKSGLSVNSYNGEIITNSGGGATTVEVTCNGSVSPVPPATLTLSTSSLSGFNYVVGTGPSTSQSYNISGSYLTGAPGNIVVTAPSNYEVSLDNSTFTNSLNIPYTSSTLSSTAVYVRLIAGLPVNSYNGEIITNTGGGATTVEVTCNGSVSPVPPATLTLSTSSLSSFNYVVGTGPSTSQSYNISGSYLTGTPGNIVVTAPSNYEISIDNATFTNSLNIPYTSSTLSTTTVYVRLIAGLPVNSYNGEIITNEGGGATQLDLTCNGTVSDVSNACATDLIISEYHEPASGNNKGVEIYNSTGGDVDLSNYYIGTIVNGGTDVENSQVLSGILGDKQTVCIYNDQDADPNFRLKGNINITWTNATWNGDDAVYLLKGGATKDFIIDVIGNIPPVTDPGTEFLDNSVGTANATLVRKSSVVSPATVWSGLEWNDIAPGTYSDWGIHTMTCSTGNLNNVNQNNFDISLFPNPANNNITINYNGKLSEVVAVKIINSIGKILLQTNNNFSSILNTSIDIDFCSGLYFVFLETENKTFIKKLIINKK